MYIYRILAEDNPKNSYITQNILHAFSQQEISSSKNVEILEYLSETILKMQIFKKYNNNYIICIKI